MTKTVPNFITQTLEEAQAIALMRLTKALQVLRGAKEIIRKYRLGPFTVRYYHYSANSAWGRLGGGWQWGLGIEGSKRSILLLLLFCQITITKEKHIHG